MERIQRTAHSSDDKVQAKATAMPAGDPGGRQGMPPQVQGHGQPSAGPWMADDGLMDAMGLGVQRDNGGGGGEDTGSVHAAAAHGVSGSGGSLPHLDQIQKSFGPDHDVSGISSHVGGKAADACDAIGASAYASGNSVAFKGSPDLHTAAHEAAHVVQQKQGISLYGGVGVAGDVHEQHADAVADRVVAGQSAADLLTAGSSGGAMPGVQRKQVQRDEAKPSDGDGAAKPAGDGGDKKADAAPGGGAGGPAAPSKKTVDVLLSAIYEEVPGDAKDKVRRATGKEAVWLDPLTMYSNYPQEKRRMLSHGVVAGGGEQTVETYQAPISEKDPVSGRGSITAQLKYAADTNKSFSVTVSNIKKNDVAGAEKAARTFIEKEIQAFGDLDEIQTNTEKHLKGLDAKYDGAKVTVDVKESKTHEAGSTSFNYKVRTNAGIRMDLLAQPVGEKVVKSSGSKTTETGTEDESRTKQNDANQNSTVKREDDSKYKKEDHSTETHDVDYYERVAKTLDDYVTKTTTVRDELLSDLAEKTVTHKHSDYDDHEVTDNKKGHHEDYTKDYKHTTESGERDKENWAAKLRKGTKIIKDITKIPFVDKIPGVGWFTRKVKGWQIDLIDAGLGLFEEKGKVKFTDVKEDTKIKSDGSSTDKTDRKRDVELTEDEKKEYGRKLKEEFKSDTKDDWERHMKDITETSKTYRSKIQKDATTTVDRNDKSDYKRNDDQHSTENENKHKERKNQTTTATFESVSTWKFSKPVVKATVVSGDAEVSNTPFGPEPGEEGGKVEVVKPGTP